LTLALTTKSDALKFRRFDYPTHRAAIGYQPAIVSSLKPPAIPVIENSLIKINGWRNLLRNFPLVVSGPGNSNDCADEE
jgi:hypothetical protein